MNDAPTISTISNPTCLEDQSVSGLAFTISDPETSAADLILSATSSNAALLPTSRIYLGGSASARSVSLVPLAHQNGSSTVTITVTDGLLSASRTFVLNVTPVNDAPTLDALPNLALPTSAPTQVVNLTGVSSGAPNEAQTLHTHGCFIEHGTDSEPGCVLQQRQQHGNRHIHAQCQPFRLRHDHPDLERQRRHGQRWHQSAGAHV